MKKLLLVCLTYAACAATYAQTFVNRGAPVAVTQGGLMIVKTDGVTTGSGSLENDAAAAGSTGGVFKNKGTVIVEGSLINTSGVADGYAASTGQYFVQGDWVNNATFTADQSLVNLYGPTQLITGSNATTFYNLTDSTGVKTQTLDAYVSNVLRLSAAEHATASNFLTVTNADPAAIVQNTLDNGFVSSTAGGRLIRNTNQHAEYIFPTGIANSNSPKIREASVLPTDATPRSYKVRYAENAPSTTTTTDDGYDTLKKSGGIGEVNDVFYHIVVASDNSPADLSIFSNPVIDQTWTSIGSWQGSPSQWENLQDVVTLSGQFGSNRPIKLTKAAWVPTINDTVFALVDTIPLKRDFTFPTAFIPDGQGVDPANIVFTIINQGDLVSLDQLLVFDRWGERVFDSQRDGTDKWDGHFHGKLQQQGNYVYLAKVRNKQTNKLYPTVTGNVSLIW